MATRIAVHGHFYQPPRENPWTLEIDAQPSARPFHDWNERVHAECYRPNALARIPGEKGRERTVNNFERLSFNVGPTLLQWMETADPEVYYRIIDADRKSWERSGHGNAMAQAYHHTILPLSPVREVRTQVRWGTADFRHRFGRDPEGMWLPETAANPAVLEVLIEEGLTFTVLAPGQAGAWRHDGQEWVTAEEEAIDPRYPYRYLHRDGSGRSLAAFFYDGDIARRIAFERAGSSSEHFIDLFESRFEEDGMLIHAATDGETYGHHHAFSDLGLAYALFVEGPRRGIEITNYGSFLEIHPPEREVKLATGDGTSWSCAHGIDRWRADCGCHTGGEPGWNQTWRAPLRDGLDVLKAAADETYERLGSKCFVDAWGARDRYVEVAIGAREAEEFVRAEASSPVGQTDLERMHALLELQRNAMSLYTSCAWFFNDVGGIETIQILRYAARTVDLLEELKQPTSEDAFLKLLDQAKSNDPKLGTGAGIYIETKDSRRHA